MMENNGRLYSQVAAEAGVSSEKALAAVYLSNLAKSGKSIDGAAALAKLHRADARDIARDWGFSFHDYVPGLPLRLDWIKVQRGLWELRLTDGMAVARVLTAKSGDVRIYRASWDAGGYREDGSNAEIAARRLSVEIDRQSRKLFGVDDLEIRFPLPDGMSRVAPKTVDAGTARKLRMALGSEQAHA